MKYIKFVFLIISTIASLKPIIIVTEQYDHQKTLLLFSQLYDSLTTITPLELSKDEFLEKVDRWISFFLKVVDFLWEINPELCHTMVWKWVGIERSIWLGIAGKLVVYAQESKEEIDAKIAYYSHLYNLKVVEALIAKDLEIQLKKFEPYWKQSVQKAVEEIMQKLCNGEPPEDDWLWYYDTNGLHENPNRIR